MTNSTTYQSGDPGAAYPLSMRGNQVVFRAFANSTAAAVSINVTSGGRTFDLPVGPYALLPIFATYNSMTTGAETDVIGYQK